jgi:heme/copper-type cytochrome/quinol oxidase subunit 1
MPEYITLLKIGVLAIITFMYFLIRNKPISKYWAHIHIATTILMLHLISFLSKRVSKPSSFDRIDVYTNAINDSEMLAICFILLILAQVILLILFVKSIFSKKIKSNLW